MAAGQGTEARGTATGATAEPTAETVVDGKLLDPCGLITPDEVEELVDQPILSDYRYAQWRDLPLATGDASEIMGTGYYECEMTDFDGDGTVVSIDVFGSAKDAQDAQLEYVRRFNDRLADFGLEPYAEISGIGDKAFAPPAPATETSVPDLLATSGPYLLSFNLEPPGRYSWDVILRYAQLVLDRLPEDTGTILTDENSSMNINQPAGKLLEPCALVTLDEARGLTADLMEKPIEDEKSESQWGIGGIDSYMCGYLDEDIAGADIWVWHYDKIDDYFANPAFQGVELRDVEGLGDRAFTNSPLFEAAEITVVSGNFVIDIDFYDLSARPTLQDEKARTMAELALGRLPQ